MLPILRPMALSARTADSRPGPGPLMRTSMFFTPHSCAARPAHRQALAMTHAAVAAQVHEALDRHRHFPAQIAFDGELLHVLAQAVEIRVGEILDLARTLHTGGDADGVGARAANAEDRRQGD